MLLVKFNLSFMVVFSAVISYLLAPMVKVFDWKAIMLLFVGGMLVTGSANAINQALEKTYGCDDEAHGRKAGCIRKNDGYGSDVLCGNMRTCRYDAVLAF